jgi:hypothetical protein
MYRLIPILLLCVAGTAQSSPSAAIPATPSRSGTAVETPMALPPAQPELASGKLPAPPRGKSTVIGGQIGSVDPVRDQIKLKVFGGNTMTILFDERTQVYRDGVRESVLSLRPNERASVETTLDGTAVFALRIHMLSHTEQGDTRGQIVRFDPVTGRLALAVGIAGDLITLRVTGETSVDRVGQDALPGKSSSIADLVPGAIVFAKFRPGGDGDGLVTRIQVIASPGAVFVFSGDVTFLDLRAGKIVVADPHFEQPREISFNPAIYPSAGELHEGTPVTVTTMFDGTRFTASQIVVN